MNRASLYAIGVIVAVVGFMASMFVSFAPKSSDGLDAAMQAYLNCIVGGDKETFLTFFSKTNNWRFISYRAVTHATVRNTSITYEDTIHEMSKEGGLWSAFFDGTDQYRYRDRIAHHPLRTWTRDETTYNIPRSEGVISFVRWAKDDDGRWVIKIIGDDSP